GAWPEVAELGVSAEVSEKLSALPVASAVALHLKADQYFDAIQGLIDRFATKKDLEVIYVTSTIPSQSILNAMEALEIPVEHIWFVDCITQIMMYQAKRHPHSNVVEYQTMLETSMMKVDDLLRDNTAQRQTLDC